MSSVLRRWNRLSRLLAVSDILAFAGFVVIAIGALTLDSPHSVAADQWITVLPEAETQPSSLRDSLIREAVTAAPFQPNRTPREKRYALPSARSSDSLESPPSNSLRHLRLVGTAVQSSGAHVAAFHLNQQPRVVRSGGRIEGYQVTEIQPGSVILVGPDTTVSLHIERPASKGQPP